MGYNNFSGVSTKSYEAMIAELQQLDSEFVKYQSVMTGYERTKALDVIAGKRDEYRDVISAAAVQRHKTAAKNLKAALEAAQVERRKIANSWDYAKLANEMQVAKMRIDAAAKSDIGRFDIAAVVSIKKEAELSGDKHRIRAVYEALQDLVSKVPEGSGQNPYGGDVRMTANRIARQSWRELQEMNTSEGLQAAEAAIPQRVEELERSKGNLFNVAELLGDCLPGASIIHNSMIDDALRIVEQNNNGDFIFNDKEGV